MLKTKAFKACDIMKYHNSPQIPDM